MTMSPERQACAGRESISSVAACAQAMSAVNRRDHCSHEAAGSSTLQENSNSTLQQVLKAGSVGVCPHRAAAVRTVALQIDQSGYMIPRKQERTGGDGGHSCGLEANIPGRSTRLGPPSFVDRGSLSARQVLFT